MDFTEMDLDLIISEFDMYSQLNLHDVEQTVQTQNDSFEKLIALMSSSVAEHIAHDDIDHAPQSKSDVIISNWGWGGDPEPDPEPDPDPTNPPPIRTFNPTSIIQLPGEYGIEGFFQGNNWWMAFDPWFHGGHGGHGGPTGGGGGGDPAPEDEGHDCPTQSAADISALLAVIEHIAPNTAADGNEWAAIIVREGNHISFIGPITSGEPSHVDEEDILTALDGFEGEILGVVHSHPAISGALYTPAEIRFNNFNNQTPSSTDVDIDNYLSENGFNISSDFNHYIYGPDGVLRAFSVEAEANQRDGEREVHFCPNS